MKRIILLIAFTISILALLLWLTRSVPYCGEDFLKGLWGPVSMLVRHQTPYSFNTPYGPYPGVWMPPILGLFFPFGYVSCDIAAKLWLITEMAGFMWVLWLIADYKMPRPWAFAICLLVFFLFPPVWFHVKLAQFTMLFVILMMVIVYLPQADRFIPLILVLGVTKPQLAILVYPGILANTWRIKGFRGALRLVLLTGLVALLTMIPIFLYYPGWVADFLFVTFDNLGVHWNLPTLFVQLPLRFGIAGYAVWAFVLLSTLITSIWLWLKKDPKIALIASLAMTPMVTTYASSWDFVLLLPAFFWLTINLRTVAARAVLFTGILLVFIGQIVPRIGHPIPDGTQWWVPPTLILLYLVSLAIDHRDILKGFRFGAMVYAMKK